MSNKVKWIPTKRKNVSHNASPLSQIYWGLQSDEKKNLFRKISKDTDRDGTPDWADCHIRDPNRQEQWQSNQKREVSKIKSVKTGKYIAEGGRGQVHTVQGKPGLVVKTPVRGGNKRSFMEEAEFYKLHNLINEPLFIPTKVVTVNGKPAMLRPRVDVIAEPARSTPSAISNNVSDKQLEKIRKGLVDLSRKGFIFNDYLQIGIDDSGRPLIFDTGEMTISDSKTAFRTNNREWIDLLVRIGRAKRNDIQTAIKKYGSIKP